MTRTTDERRYKENDVTKDIIAQLKVQQVVLKLEEVFLEAVIQRRGGVYVSELAKQLGINDLIGDDHGSALARGIAASLEKMNAVKIKYPNGYWHVQMRSP